MQMEVGVCGVGRLARVSSAFAHFGEEQVLRGRRGSGTIFFAGCNLLCVFCQNADISQERRAGVATGREVSAEQLAALMLELQREGCHNINLVSPAHVVPQVVEALQHAFAAGLDLPIVYNSGGYDSLETLRLLDGLVQIYMPDFKLWRAESAKRLLGAEDYPQRAREALAEMQRQVGVLTLGEGGVAERGVLVRHLVMPGYLEESAAIFAWLAETLSPETYVNVMGQYRAAHRVGEQDAAGQPRYPRLEGWLGQADYRAALEAASRAGLRRLDGIS